MTTNILDLVNIGDIVTIPSILVHDKAVVAFGHNTNIGSWITVDSGYSGSDQFVLATESDLFNARIITFNSIPRNTEFIKWIVPNGDDYTVQLASSYGHLGNCVWDFQGKRIDGEDLMNHIREANPSNPNIKPLALCPISHKEK